MMNVVAVGSKVMEMFQIEEYTAEAFEKGMKAAGWEYADRYTLAHKNVIRYENGYELEEVEEVSMYNVCVEMEMSYSEYKTNYSDRQTKKGSYNKDTKTIVVYVAC